MGRNFSNSFKITKVADHTTAGTGDVTATSVDMSGYNGVIFLTSYGTAAADNLIHAETSSDNITFNDLTGTEVGVSTSDEDQWVEIVRPLERYIRVIAERGTSSTCESIWAIQYGARSQAVDNTTAGTIHGEIHSSPAEGTK